MKDGRVWRYPEDLPVKPPGRRRGADDGNQQHRLREERLWGALHERDRNVAEALSNVTRLTTTIERLSRAIG